MSKGKSALPMSSRVGIFLASSVGLIVILVQFASLKFRQELDLANGFVYAVAMIVSCFGLWLSLFAKKYQLEELEAMNKGSTPKLPEVPEHAIECRFHVLNKSAAIFFGYPFWTNPFRGLLSTSEVADFYAALV